MPDDADPMETTTPSSDAAESADRGRLIAVVYLFTMFCFGVGVATTYPYLERELGRIEPEKRRYIWGAELPALIWFTWYFVKNYLLVRPVPSPTHRPFFVLWQWWFALVTLMGGLGVGLWNFIELWRDDVAGRSRAIATDGQIVSMSKWTTVAAYGYFLDVQFLDQNGVPHDGVFHVVENKKRGFFPRIPDDMKNALKNRKLPGPVKLFYDPEWPRRSWLAEARGGLVDDYRNRLFYLGISLIVVQLVAIFIFALALRYSIQEQNQLPWWYDLHLAIPLVIVAVFSGFIGGFVVGLSSLFDWILREA